MTKMEALSTTVSIAPRYRGPDASGNGGYVCGLVAQFVDGPAAVTLRQAPPLERPLALQRDDEGVRLLDGETVVAEARPWSAPIEPPPPVSLDTATRAATHPDALGDHPFPRCFVCGPAREDGLRIFPGEVGDGLFAAPWVPAADLSDDDGRVGSRFCWAALDCPSGWATTALATPGEVAVLGRLTSVIHDRPAHGSAVVTVASADERDGRKLASRSALYTASGRLLAVATAIWIVIDPPR